MINVKVICDSVSPQDKRLTTFKLRYPKFIHSELMTHRVLSRNASSSRAVPTAKLLAEVRSDAERATFVHWGADQKGMGTAQELSDEISIELGNCSEKEVAQYWWKMAAENAAEAAEAMLQVGAAKQLVNRLLEPFSHINVVVSATEWDNFFGLRLDKAAQPEIDRKSVV